MSSGKQRDEQVIDDAVLADDALLDLATNLTASPRDLGDGLEVGGGAGLVATRGGGGGRNIRLVERAHRFLESCHRVAVAATKRAEAREHDKIAERHEASVRHAPRHRG